MLLLYSLQQQVRSCLTKIVYTNGNMYCTVYSTFVFNYILNVTLWQKIYCAAGVSGLAYWVSGWAKREIASLYTVEDQLSRELPGSCERENGISCKLLFHICISNHAGHRIFFQFIIIIYIFVYTISNHLLFFLSRAEFRTNKRTKWDRLLNKTTVRVNLKRQSV